LNADAIAAVNQAGIDPIPPGQENGDATGGSMFGKLKGKGSQGSGGSVGSNVSYGLTSEELRQIELEAAAEERAGSMASNPYERRTSKGSAGAGEDMFDLGDDLLNDELDAEDVAQTSGADVDVHRFDELSLDPNIISECQSAWATFCSNAGSREAAGEALYNAFYDSVPDSQHLFSTPRAVQAMRFMNGFHGFAKALDNPAALKVLVETLGFFHLNFDVSVPRVVNWRDALLDLFEVELGDKFTQNARHGWKGLMNYIGGAIIYVKVHYAERLKIIEMTWKEANKGEGGGSGKLDSFGDSDSGEMSPGKSPTRKKGNQEDSHSEGSGEQATAGDKAKKKGGKAADNAANVPTTYADMFQFNCAVMGFGSSAWMNEVVSSFDAIVVNVSNSARFQEECAVLALRISKCCKGAVNLPEYKSCMLASLRSLLPKIWEPAFEVAWAWLWDNVERLLLKTLGSPPLWERALIKLINSTDENQRYELRAAIYARFFDLAPTGQDYFKQSNTRLHFIADRVFSMTMEFYREPARMVEEISAYGLRAVGYGVPTDLIGPFVTSCIEILADMSKDELAIEAFRWSLGLIAKILVRTITEGSTIVMKAINANSAKLLVKAASCAPRDSRATWLLLIEVGSQKISPLIWAIESGSLEAAGAIIKDLLTIRADRERYYYSVDELFVRHPDIVYRLTADAPTLLPTLLEGLIWRSRQVSGGLRRVNYYTQHLLITHEGGANQALEWLAASKDVKIIAHPLIAFVSDTLWSGVVRRQFSVSKIWFVLSLLVFLVAQAILPKLVMTQGSKADKAGTKDLRYAILGLRGLTYLFCWGRLVFQHSRKIWKSIVTGSFSFWMCLPIPDYLKDKYLACSFLLFLMLSLMLASEPLIFCQNSKEWPTEVCPEAKDVEFRYGVFGMCAMASLWLLVIDMSVFSTKLSAFVLVCGHVLQEVGRFMVALIFLLLTFASAISVLKTEHEEFADVPSAMVSLFAVTVGIYEKDFREMNNEPVLLAAVFLFIAASAILLLNLLIAQLNCSYEYVYADMVGFARMNRANLIVESLISCTEKTWNIFVTKLRMDEPLEFDEGDIGPPGGMQILESSSSNPVLVDMIRRFGGACSGDMPWPEDTAVLGDSEDKYAKMEALVNKALKKMAKGGGGQEEGHEGSGFEDLGTSQDDEGKFNMDDDDDYGDEEGDYDDEQ
jgi:hemoglobin-like flavoprotein